VKQLVRRKRGTLLPGNEHGRDGRENSRFRPLHRGGKPSASLGRGKKGERLPGHNFKGQRGRMRAFISEKKRGGGNSHSSLNLPISRRRERAIFLLHRKKEGNSVPLKILGGKEKKKGVDC